SRAVSSRHAEHRSRCSGMEAYSAESASPIRIEGSRFRTSSQLLITRPRSSRSALSRPDTVPQPFEGMKEVCFGRSHRASHPGGDLVEFHFLENPENQRLPLPGREPAYGLVDELLPHGAARWRARRGRELPLGNLVQVDLPPA